MNADTLTFGPLGGLTATDRRLLLVSIAAGVLYLVVGAMGVAPVRTVIKGLGVAPLAVLAFRLLRGHDRVLLGAALSFSSLGDVLLDLPGRFFVQGLLAFLVAHLCYIALFVRSWSRPLRPRAGQLALALGVVAYSVVLFSWLASGLGELAVPVTFYSGALTLMAVAAILAGFTTPTVVGGAILFVISDSVIATSRFKTAVPLGGVLVWVTYYAGQYCIAVGFLREKLGASGDSRPAA